MKKIFVLDTSVLLFDPVSIFKFEDNDVLVPLIVIEELDKFKRNQDENGRNARQFSRLVDDLRQKGSLSTGVELEGGGKLIVTLNNEYKGKNSFGIDLSINDNLILAQALTLKENGQNVVLVSKDINLRVKGDALGVVSVDYLDQNLKNFKDTNSVHRTLEVSSAQLSEFENNRFLSADECDLGDEIYPNEYMIVCEENNPQHRQLCRFSKKKNGLVPLIRVREGVWGIYPKNIEQQFALDALLNEEVSLVSLIGKAGTGKTLLAIAAGLELTVAQKKYKRLLVSRPIIPMGRDLGFLPGDIDEKLGPWMQPIFDNIDYLFGSQENKQEGWDDLISKGLLHVEPLTYIRGRTLPSQYMIVDEAQNLSPHEIKTIITRAGDGTKIVLTGDCEQIDNPYLDSINNGLTYAIDRLKSEEIVAHSLLNVGERSQLSEVASKLL